PGGTSFYPLDRRATTKEVLWLGRNFGHRGTELQVSRGRTPCSPGLSTPPFRGGDSRPCRAIGLRQVDAPSMREWVDPPHVRGGLLGQGGRRGQHCRQD